MEFVEVDGGLLLVPLKTLRELRGAGKDNSKAMIEGIKELEKEHREEVRRN